MTKYSKELFEKVHLHDSKEMEAKLTSLLKKEGYSVLVEPSIPGFDLRPDLIINKDGKSALVELKVQKSIVTKKVLFQIMYYLSKTNFELAYLALPFECKIKKSVKDQLLKNNIGLITIRENFLTFEEPKGARALSPEDSTNYELYSEQKVIEEKVNETSNELRTISKELFLYVLIGGLLVYAISKSSEYYLAAPYNFEVLFFSCCLAIFLYCIFLYCIHILRKNRHKNRA